MRILFVVVILPIAWPAAAAAQDAKKTPVETSLAGPRQTMLTVRMQGPYDADVPLQVVCYFKRTPRSDARMSGAPVDLDKHLGGLIGSLRTRGDFGGDDLETILFDVPGGTIRPKRLLLIGLGDESTLSVEKMERVGRTALREAARLGATSVAFAPLIRDQGNSAIATGEVERAVTRGVLLAYETEKRLQDEGFARPFTLAAWVVEAGPKYYDETIEGVRKAIADVKAEVSRRDARPYSVRGR